MMTFKHFLDESINDAGIFKAVFIVGIPGAGKSYTVKKLRGRITPVVVNTDRAAEFIGRKKGIPVNAQTWADTIEDSALSITSSMLFNYLNSILPLFVDGTSNNVARIMHRYGILESLGYDVGIIHVKTSLETAIERAHSRALDIGRDVDDQFIRETYETSLENVAFLKSKTSFFREINNDDGELTSQVIESAFKSVQSFFTAPLANPVGKRSLVKMRAEKQKYLTPSVIGEAQLKHLVQGWYK